MINCIKEEELKLKRKIKTEKEKENKKTRKKNTNISSAQNKRLYFYTGNFWQKIAQVASQSIDYFLELSIFDIKIAIRFRQKHFFLLRL